MKVLILEDCHDRREKMSEFLSAQYPDLEIQFFITAGDFISGYGAVDAKEIAAIALDHDLEMIERDDGTMLDPGDGRQVADYLATQECVCPVIIHSTNSPAAVGMESVLTDAGWSVKRVFPYGDLEWIDTMWFPAMRNAITPASG